MQKAQIQWTYERITLPRLNSGFIDIDTYCGYSSLYTYLTLSHTHRIENSYNHLAMKVCNRFHIRIEKTIFLELWKIPTFRNKVLIPKIALMIHRPYKQNLQHEWAQYAAGGGFKKSILSTIEDQCPIFYPDGQGEQIVTS